MFVFNRFKLPDSNYDGVYLIVTDLLGNSELIDSETLKTRDKLSIKRFRWVYTIDLLEKNMLNIKVNSQYSFMITYQFTKLSVVKLFNHKVLRRDNNLKRKILKIIDRVLFTVPMSISGPNAIKLVEKAVKNYFDKYGLNITEFLIIHPNDNKTNN